MFTFGVAFHIFDFASNRRQVQTWYVGRTPMPTLHMTNCLWNGLGHVMYDVSHF